MDPGSNPPTGHFLFFAYFIVYPLILGPLKDWRLNEWKNDLMWIWAWLYYFGNKTIQIGCNILTLSYFGAPVFGPLGEYFGTTVIIFSALSFRRSDQDTLQLAVLFRNYHWATSKLTSINYLPWFIKFCSTQVPTLKQLAVYPHRNWTEKFILHL